MISREHSIGRVNQSFFPDSMTIDTASPLSPTCLPTGRSITHTHSHHHHHLLEVLAPGFERVDSDHQWPLGVARPEKLKGFGRSEQIAEECREFLRVAKVRAHIRDELLYICSPGLGCVASVPVVRQGLG